MDKKYSVNKSEEEWKQELSAEEYYVLRQKGTERPYTGKFDLHFENGDYHCKACNAKLFESEHKFESGCGWPSFDQAVEGAIEYIRDTSHGMIRTETVCANCGSHLGHVFNDGPKETTGQRYCINSASIDFDPEAQMDFQENYLGNVQFEFHRYKTMGDKTFDQILDADIHWKFSDSDNSIAIIVKHMVGNMLSRWTNFLTEDGEKPWRERDLEFEKPYSEKSEMIAAWEKGWQCLFGALDSINSTNFENKIKIRNEEHSIVEAINRQLAHYASHVGQIVFIGRMIKGTDWDSLSIPKGESKAFNKKMFDTGKA